jgi:MinD-like ATPase involved in chromosome partitioning or flagellar assembly
MRHTKVAKSYLNALSLGDDKLDMFNVFNGIYPQMTKWTELFYNQKAFETDIHAEFNNSEAFRQFYFESKNIQKTRGQHPFGFGYPFVFDLDTEGETVAAPLFIWYLNIKPHPTRRDSWVLSYDENSSVAVNEYLVEHFRTKHKLDLTDHLGTYIQNPPYTYLGFQAFCKDLATQLKYSQLTLNSSITQCPSPKYARELGEKGNIAWCGAVGLFPHPDGSLKESETESIDFQNFTWTAEHSHEFTVLPEDIYQRTALRTVLRNKITVIEGGHGTGKTHLAANILLNALSNGQKTAIVADDVASLMQIQNELVKLNLGNLAFLLKDIYQDKNLLLDVVRKEQSGKSVDFKDEDDFKIALKQARRYLAKSDDTHHTLGQPIFGDENFAEVVGHYLASQKKAGRELLANHLNASDYTFSKEEYESLRAAIEKSEQLYKDVNTLKHPLSNLNPVAFSDEKVGSNRDNLKEKIAVFIEKFKSLHLRHIVVYDAYSQKLMSYYESYFVQQREQMRHLKEAYSDYEFQYGDAFKSFNVFRMSGLYASSFFSGRSKNILSAKEEALTRYDELVKTYETRKHFNHTFLNVKDRKDFDKLKLNLETFESLLRGWRKALPNTVQEELQRLNSKTAQYFDKPLAEEILQLETDLDNLLAEVNDAKIYAEPLGHKMLTLPKRMLFIEETLGKLEETQLNMRDFDNFYAWQRFWVTLPTNAHRAITALTKVKPENWTTAFDSWYFHNTLVVHYQSDTLGNDALMNDMNEVEDRLRTHIPLQIAKMWHTRKKAAVKEMKEKDPNGYNLFFSSKNVKLAKSKYLKDILRGTVQTLTEVFPVLLVTPQVATQIIEAEGKEFDLVIFDNAQNIEVEQVVPILRNTEGVVVLTEDTTVPNSLAAKLREKEVAFVHLNYLHRASSETTRRINQSVFYPNVDIPFRQVAAEQSVEVRYVKGKFSEKTRSNEPEITEIVELLKEISATPFNTYPRIAIVTMTKQQRNTLNMTLLNVVQKTLWGWEKIEHIQRNGLTVLSIDELAGLQFDILVVSGTYADFDGMSFPKRTFRQLLNCFTQKLYWVNSIPREILTHSATSHDYEMPFLMSNLILFAENIEQGQTPQYETIFSRLRALYGKPKVPKSSFFVNEVIAALSDTIDSKRMKTNFKIENQIFPFVILPDNDEDKAFVVRIDGRLSTDAAYFNADWERRILQDLERLNIGVLSIWSYNWWKDVKGETAKLVASIKGN